MFSNDILPKICPKYYCENCDYGTSKKSSYDDHLLSAKHNKSMVSHQILPKLCSKYICQNCNKEYKDNSGLWRHKKKCSLEKKPQMQNDSLIIELMKHTYIYFRVNENTFIYKRVNENTLIYNRVNENTLIYIYNRVNENIIELMKTHLYIYNRVNENTLI